MRTIIFQPFNRRAVNLQTYEGVPGIYILGFYDKKERRIELRYFGRSDSCLRRRLNNHILRSGFEYFYCVSCVDSIQAFFRECSLWHALEGEDHILNKIHPDTPNGAVISCPYCATTAEFRKFITKRLAG